MLPDGQEAFHGMLNTISINLHTLWYSLYHIIVLPQRTRPLISASSQGPSTHTGPHCARVWVLRMLGLRKH
jgi:hypothetical protein